MKTLSHSWARISPITIQVKLVLLILVALISLAGCKKNDEAVLPAAAAFEGKYEVQSSDPSEVYTFTFTKHPTKANSFNITKMLSFLNVPLVAEAVGTQLTIPSQTFKNPNGKQLVISGNGTLNGDVLSIKCAVRGFADLDYDLTAKRKP
jgi:hypothetical protein